MTKEQRKKEMKKENKILLVIALIMFFTINMGLLAFLYLFGDEYQSIFALISMSIIYSFSFCFLLVFIIVLIGKENKRGESDE